MVVKVCVGSSCHLKGSYEVIEKLKEIVQKYNLENDVELAASFCAGECHNSVIVSTGGYVMHNVDKNNAEDKFVREILPLIK